MVSKENVWTHDGERAGRIGTQNATGTTDNKPSRIDLPLSATKHKFGGLFTRKERWGLSARGWLVALLAVVVLVVLVFPNLYSFLAITQRVPTKILVVEGWIHPFAARVVAEEFR